MWIWKHECSRGGGYRLTVEVEWDRAIRNSFVSEYSFYKRDDERSWEVSAILYVCVKIGRVTIVEQIISSNKRSVTSVERGHYNLTSPQVQNCLREVSRHDWQACDTSIGWHDGWCKTAPCWLLTTMSSGCFSCCPLLISWKSKITKTKSKVSNEYQMVHTSWQLPASGSAWKWTSDRLDNEGVYHGGRQSYGDKF